MINRFSKNRHRRDNNHKAIVARLRELGCSVRDCSQVGDHGPDLWVGILGRDYGIEIKDVGKFPTVEQAQYAEAWNGQPIVVMWTLEQCEKWVNDTRRRIIDAFR